MASRVGNVQRLWLPALLIGAFLFYLATLAPTVLWGDNAYFQRSAYEHLLKADAGGHWLWLQLAEQFVKIPWQNVAFRVNLLSAVAAVATLFFLVKAMLALGLNWKSAFIAVIALAVSHTFWMHAVRAEVYTLFTAAMALQLWLWFSWQPQKAWPAYLAAALFGVTLLAHQMALLLIPAALYLLWRQRAWLSGKGWLAFWLLMAAGLLPFVAVLLWQTHSETMVEGLWRYFTQVDVDFSQAMFDFSLSQVVRDSVIWIGLLGLQFVGMATLLGIYGMMGNTLKVVAWQTLLILYVTGVLFAFSYRVNDQFVFYLPTYVGAVFFIANGCQRLQTKEILRSRRAFWLLLTLIVLLPIATYATLPVLLNRLQMNPLNIRTLPGREPNRYFLWPGSRSDRGAEEFAWNALEGLPPHSVVIADHTPLEPMRYLQNVEGVRPDVNLVKIEPGDELAPVIEKIPPDHAIFLADRDPRYYALDALDGYCLLPFGPIFEVVRTNEAGQCRSG